MTCMHVFHREVQGGIHLWPSFCSIGCIYRGFPISLSSRNATLVIGFYLVSYFSSLLFLPLSSLSSLAPFLFSFICLFTCITRLTLFSHSLSTSYICKFANDYMCIGSNLDFIIFQYLNLEL